MGASREAALFSHQDTSTNSNGQTCSPKVNVFEGAEEVVEKALAVGAAQREHGVRGRRLVVHAHLHVCGVRGASAAGGAGGGGAALTWFILLLPRDETTLTRLHSAAPRRRAHTCLLVCIRVFQLGGVQADAGLPLSRGQVLPAAQYAPQVRCCRSMR